MMRRRSATTLLAGTLLVFVVAILVGCGDAGSTNLSARDQMQAIGGGTAGSQTRMSENVSARYRFIESHQQEAERIPCYCECRSLGHTSLRDCFVTDGGAFEVHGSRCGVCLAEAQTLETMLAQGHSLTDIRATIDALYSGAGTPTDTP
jgi:hypothetical protein